MENNIDCLRFTLKFALIDKEIAMVIARNPIILKLEDIFNHGKLLLEVVEKYDNVINNEH